MQNWNTLHEKVQLYINILSQKIKSYRTHDCLRDLKLLPSFTEIEGLLNSA